jgi:[ribosomal protein S5]-alanine N-acetyltransferase
MKVAPPTERLYFRELLPEDDINMFNLDSDPEVHTYLWDKTVTDIEQSRKVIEWVRYQYETRGIGRVAVILKETNEFIGWAGLKLEMDHINGREGGFYDIGYRLMKKHWGKGYATEANRAWIDFGFNQMNLDIINAFAFTTNGASRRVLEKSGMRHMENFLFEGIEAAWYEINNPRRP